MNVIELERWKPSAENPRKLEYAGQPTAEEVFQELKHRLEGMGCLPDEYFLLSMDWENGREIPRGADIICRVDYGESEGIYLDIGLTWYDEEQKRNVIKDFVTGKTLGENGNDLDRMYLIASAVTKAFHGDHATHARYMKIGGVEEDAGGSVVHLSQQEQRTIIEALVEQRERQENAMSQTEQLLRRMTGSITAYMDTVGQRPLRLSDYDRASLAIRDGELKVVQELWPKARDQADGLFLEAASRPGDVGRRMLALAMPEDRRYPADIYLEACRRAVDIGDGAKVEFLLSMADQHGECVTPALHGEVAHYAYRDHKWIAADIVEKFTEEQFKAAPYFLMMDAVQNRDYATASKLAERGFNADACFADIVRCCSNPSDEWQLTHLLELGLRVSPDSFDALHACVECGCFDAGNALLDRGMNLVEYEDWANRSSHGLPLNETLESLREHWRELQAQTQEQADAQGEQETAEQTGGMTFG